MKNILFKFWSQKFPILMFGALLLYFLINIFSVKPFLQHELVGQAFWWVQSKIGFLKLIFSSSEMDCAPGRFRYIEYLLQAFYWRAMSHGWIPRDLYDYIALLLNILSAYLLLQIGKKKKLSFIQSFIFCFLFLTSTQAFMTVVFNFRKAKILTSLYFLLMVYFSNLKKEKIYFYLIFFLSILGVITDPYYILISPVVAFGIDFSLKNRKYPTLRATAAGLLSGFLLVLLLNEIIGPHFSDSSRLELFKISNKPINFLDFSNILSFPFIIPDLISPLLFDSLFQYLGFLSFFLLLFTLFFMFRSPQTEKGFLISFLISLPIGAFCLLPTREIAYFSGYYGHTFLILFLLALIEIFLYFKSLHPGLANGFLLLITFIFPMHQYTKPIVFKKWQQIYTESESVRNKVYQDYDELKKIDAHLRNKNQPYELIMDIEKINKLYLSKGRYFDEEGRLNRTDLAYLLIPSIFQTEIDTGKIKIISKLGK